MRLALIGCGAISQTSYAPAIRALGNVEVVGVFDPNEARVTALQALLPGARRLESVAEAAQRGAEAVIVASPSAYHAAQTLEALDAGLHVLVEKPIAGTVAEGERMAEAARAADRVLAVGLFRRFFPAARTLREMIAAEVLGPVRRYAVAEGGPFDWPAASAGFFQRRHAHGGVLHDVGIHVLDLLVWWFGEPEIVEYEDDAAGGLETNCRLRLTHPGGVEGEVRLSRDWATANRYFFEAERGWAAWRCGVANGLEFGFAGGAGALRATVCETVDHWGAPAPGEPDLDYNQCFTAQLQGFIRAVRGEARPAVDADEALRSLRVIEACYALRDERPAVEAGK